MINTLSLNNRIDELILKKINICKCNPCTCSKINKDQYFKELKDILKIFNIEKFASYSLKNVIEK
jgi:Golgi nucleoside diphosphatase